MSEFKLVRGYDKNDNLVYRLEDYISFSWDSLQESIVWACGSRLPTNLNELLSEPVDELWTWIQTVIDVKKQENEASKVSSSSSNVEGRKAEEDEDGNLIINGERY